LVLIAVGTVYVFLSVKNGKNKFDLITRRRGLLSARMKASLLSRDNNSCVVILRESGGRLGNRLFMFASAYGIARTHDCRLYLDQWIIDELNLLFEFDLTSTITLDEVNLLKNIYSKYTVCEFSPRFLIYNSIKHLELKGYWQAYGYFIKYTHELKTYLQINKNVTTKIRIVFSVAQKFSQRAHQFATDTYKLSERSWIKPQLADFVDSNNTRVELNHSTMRIWIQNSNIIWVGIHIRRGDFMHEYNAESSYTYISSAMDYYEKKYKNVFFIMASDDKDYCEKHFENRQNLIVTPKSYSYLEDFAILSFCQHSIITAGTFGWWTAFLAGGDVIHDVHFRAERCTKCECSREFYYPPWFLFPRER
jgi:galactoside 2-L-fucosyltransferase 1/2